ncbi:MAG: flotillin family protein [Clostridia bacterium]|nr:flotillin family protein [Clostridia bacterium]
MLGLIITGIIVVLLVAFIGASYIKCPPDMVYIISGLKKEPRMITGKATLRIPFFERVDKLTLELIQIDVKAVNVPTADFINVDVDAVANVRIPNREELIKVAARHFLNQSTGYIADNVQQVLEGNMREIIGQMALVDLVNNKQLFSQKIQENAQDDINNIGLEIVNLNVQSCTDDNDAINDLGIDNLVKIKKAAKIARAQSEKEIKIAEAKADEEGAKARAEADARIAEQQKELKLKKASFKIEQDKKNAEADAAYSIQQAEQQKTINETNVLAEIAKAEKMTELKEKEVALKEKELDALVRKQADAEKYSAEVKAQAEKMVQIQRAEADAESAKRDAEAKIALAKAEKEAAELEAEGIKAKLLAEAEGKKAILLAEAEGVKAKALAEAEGIEKKAEAQAKMKDASIVEMICAALPQIAKEVSAPLNKIDSITMYGDQSSKLIESGTQNIDKILNVAKDSLGLDLKSLITGFALNGMNKE